MDGLFRSFLGALGELLLSQVGVVSDDIVRHLNSGMASRKCLNSSFATEAHNSVPSI